MEDTSNENDPEFQLSHLYLKKIVKESHGETIRKLEFSEIYPNLLASVGGTQASIYDNENCGEHLDIMMNFVNMDTPALLTVLDVCKRASENTASEKRQVANGVDNNVARGGARDKEVESSSSSASVVVGELSKAQMLAARVVVDDGGFDEDIFVGASSMGIFPSAPTQDVESKLNGGDNSNVSVGENESASTAVPASAGVDVMPNKRLMQGLGRDVELFDRADRELNSCAWISFPPRYFLSPAQLLTLASLQTGSQDETIIRECARKLRGACDVDVTRIDRSDAWLAVGGNDGLVQLLSLAHCKSLYVLPGHCEPILSLSSGRSSTCLASLSRRYIIIWNLPLIARHHYNSAHFGGPSIDSGLGEDDFHESLLLDPSTPEHIKRLPKEYARWILQVIPAPSAHLTTLEFTAFGLCAAADTGHIYRWKFVKPPESSNTQVEVDFEVEEAPPGPRKRAAKRDASGETRKAPKAPFWRELPKAMLETRCDLFDWPNQGERVTGLVRKRSTPESPSIGLAVRTPSGCLIVFCPKESNEAAHTATTTLTNAAPERLTPVTVLAHYNMQRGSGLVQTIFGFNGKLIPNDSPSAWKDSTPATHQGIHLSRCERFAILGSSTGDAHIVQLSTESLVAKLQHKRSKGNITACLISPDAKHVLFTSDSIIWRWDYISPSFLENERAVQARAAAEGVDLPQSDPEDDAPDDVI